MVDQEVVQQELEKLRPYICENLATISLRGVRRLLEDKMNLEKGDLDGHKEYISDLMTPVSTSRQAETSEEHVRLCTSHQITSLSNPQCRHILSAWFT